MEPETLLSISVTANDLYIRDSMLLVIVTLRGKSLIYFPYFSAIAIPLRAIRLCLLKVADP